MPPTIQLKRGTAATLFSVNPFPRVGEIIFEQNTGLFKIGDGIRRWVDLPYANPQVTLSVNISNIIGLQEALNNKSDITHFHSISNVTGLQAALDTKAPIAGPTFTGTVSGITKGMVGLGNVDNTSDANKPISTAVQTALAGKAASTHTHAISEVSGLQAAIDGKQASGTYATLVSGLVPSSQLPSYVDDVLEFASLASLPATGESGKIYVTVDTAKIYRWSGSAYVEISPSPGSTDSVTEGSTNLYFTNARASAAAPVQSVAGKTGPVTLTKTDVGLGNVDNTSDANKPVSTATQTALDGKASTTHTHGNISADGKIGTASGRLIVTGTGGVLQAATQYPSLQVSSISILPQDARSDTIFFPDNTTQSTAWTGTVAAGSVTGLATVATSGSYNDLSNKPSIPSAYTLPTASSAVLGGVKIGSGISVDGNGVISASGGYTLPSATTSTLGGVIVGTGLGVASGTVSVTYGTSSTTACRGDDIRLSDARSPLSHTHTASAITDFASAVAAASPEEVVEYTTPASFPATGNSSLLYVATDDGRVYRWVGSVYAEVGLSALAPSGVSIGLVLALS
jgi:hypothetical protein